MLVITLVSCNQMYLGIMTSYCFYCNCCRLKAETPNKAVPPNLWSSKPPNTQWKGQVSSYEWLDWVGYFDNVELHWTEQEKHQPFSFSLFLRQCLKSFAAMIGMYFQG